MKTAKNLNTSSLNLTIIGLITKRALTNTLVLVLSGIVVGCNSGGSNETSSSPSPQNQQAQLTTTNAPGAAQIAINFIGNVELGDVPNAIAISPAGTHAYAATSSGYINWYNIHNDGSLSYVNHIQLGDAQNSIAISPDGRHAYSAAASGYIDWYNVANNGDLLYVDHILLQDEPREVAVSIDGQHLYSSGGSNSGFVNSYIIQPDGSLANQLIQFTNGNNYDDIAFSPDGQYAFATGKNKNSDNNDNLDWLSVNQLGTFSYVNTLGLGDAQNGVAISPSGNYLYTATAGGYLNWYSIEKLSATH